MKPTIAMVRAAYFAAVATCALAPGLSHGEIFSADLTLAPTTGPRGEYLSASYDFGVSFREVHAVTLTIDLPSGYQGTAMTTGNSSLFRSLSIQLHDPADQPPVEYFSQYLGTSALDIPSGSNDILLTRLLADAGGSTTLADWPAFLFSGSGSYYHKILVLGGDGSSVVWLTSLFV